MQIKLLQLNMWGGTLFPVLKEFLQKNDFDIICLQEVTGAQTHCGNLHSQEDMHQKVQQVLGENYDSYIEKFTRFTSNPETSYEANAIFYKKSFIPTKHHNLILTEGINPFPSDSTRLEEIPRNAVSLSLTAHGKILTVVSTHLAWAPTPLEQPHQREQNKKLVEYIKTLPSPWILTGDFNIQPDQESILDLEKLGRDLTKEYGVKNTLDPHAHTAWERIMPGFPVDYIFVSPEVKVTSFKALTDIHMSDHFGLTTTVEI